MNIIDLQERLRDFPEQALMQEMQSPSGMAPQFLVLSELKRRKRMRDDYQRAQAADMKTVAEEAITGAGVPQGGIMQMAGAMAPNTNVAQNTGIDDAIQRVPTQAPQPPQEQGIASIRGMAAGGQVRKMQEGRLTSPSGDPTRDQLIGYHAFLQSMGLPDSTESREKYALAMAIQKEKGVSPALLNYGLDRPPSPPPAVSIGDISTDLGDFMQGAAGVQPVLAQLPARNVPSVDLAPVDFDASAPPPPPARGPESSLDTLARITGEAAGVASGMGLPIPDADFSLPDLLAQTNEDGPSGPSVEEELLDINRRLQDPNLSDRERGFLENRQALLQARVQAGEIPSWFSEQINRGAAGIRRNIDPLISGGLSYFDPEAAERFAEGSDVAQQYFTEQADETAGERAARLAAAGIVEPEPEAAQAAEAEASRAAEAARMLGLNEIPERPRMVTDAGELIGEPSAAPETKPPAPPEAKPPVGGGFGPIESRIAQMLAEREKSAAADKWLALAQTGLALMASRQPTIGGAIGEAGLAGIGAMRQAQSQYDKDVLGLLNMQADIQRAKASGARATAPKVRTPAELKGALEVFEAEVKRLAKPIYGPDPSDLSGMKQVIIDYDYKSVPRDVMNDYIRLRNQYLQMFQTPVDVTS